MHGESRVNHGGSVSNACTPGGSCTHACLRQSYTETCGGGNSGSAKAPTATLTGLLLPSAVWKRLVPQVGQNRKRYLLPWSPVRTYSLAAPVT